MEATNLGAALQGSPFMLTDWASKQPHPKDSIQFLNMEGMFSPVRLPPPQSRPSVVSLFLKSLIVSSLEQ